MSKISELSDGGVIQGGDTLIAVRSGGNVKVTYGGSTTANIDGGTIDGTTIGGTTPAAGSFTTGSFTGDVSFGDNDKAIFGAGSDLQIYHDGSHSYVKDAGTGILYVQGSGQVRVGGADGTTGVEVNEGGDVKLRYNNANKLATTSTGIDVTGVITTDGMTTSADINFGDNDKAIFGAGSDLEIYHDGSNSYVADVGTGNLLVQADNFVVLETTAGANYFQGQSGGASTIYYSGSPKLDTTSTGIDVTGTVTADGITNSGIITTNDYFGLGSTYNRVANRDTNGAFGGGYNFYVDGTTPKHDSTGTLAGYYYTSGGQIRLYASPSSASDTAAIERVRIANNGDISFFEDTGTTAKFFWDSSAESLGIGTTSIAAGTKLQVAGETRIYPDSGTGVLRFGSGGVEKGKLSVDTSSNMAFETGGAEAMRIDSSGNLQIKGGSELRLNRADNATYGSIYYLTGSGGLQLNDNNGDGISFVQAGGTTEYGRFDASGNLLIGKTSADVTTQGIVLRGGTGESYFSRTNDNPVYINRNTSDGGLISFRKDGSTVGSIGTDSGAFVIHPTVSIGTGLWMDADHIEPTQNDGTRIDNSRDFGSSSFRWDDIYATNGTIQTSDRNEKQDIEALSDAEQRVAVAAKGLLRKFRWIDSVADKGDEARIHFGIIAQDLQDAFTAEGLDAGRYAMFTSTTWTDEENGEERSRMGVRYSELLAFIIAAI